MIVNLISTCLTLVSIFFFSLPAIAQLSDEELSKTIKLESQWKKGYIKLSDGNQYFGEIRCFIDSRSLSDYIEYRNDPKDNAQIFMANSCEAVKWGDLELFTLSKNFKKPYKKMFYMKMYFGDSIRVYFEPKFNKKSRLESMRFVILKEGIYTSTSKSKFKKRMRSLLNDSPLWREKAKDKSWLTFTNMYEVAKFYDKHIILASTSLNN